MQKILIVEDDKKLRQELETFLNKNGFMAKGWHPRLAQEPCFIKKNGDYS